MKVVYLCWSYYVSFYILYSEMVSKIKNVIVLLTIELDSKMEKKKKGLQFHIGMFKLNCNNSRFNCHM